jgi:hypothetical protein
MLVCVLWRCEADPLSFRKKRSLPTTHHKQHPKRKRAAPDPSSSYFIIITPQTQKDFLDPFGERHTLAYN